MDSSEKDQLPMEPNSEDPKDDENQEAEVALVEKAYFYLGGRACEDEVLVMDDFNDKELETIMEERRATVETVRANILAAQKRQKEQ